MPLDAPPNSPPIGTAVCIAFTAWFSRTPFNINQTKCFVSSPRALQFTDKHGEVCPANWQPGSATMKPDPKGSQTYFANVK